MDIQKLQELINRRGTVYFKDLIEFDFSHLDNDILQRHKARQIIWHLLNGINSTPECSRDSCDNTVSFDPMARKYRSFCSASCSNKSDVTKEKSKATNLKRYGVEYAGQSQEVLNKKKDTMLKRYGVENASKCKEFRDKAKATNLERYGTENPLGNKEIRSKAKATNIKKFGVEYPMQNKKVRQKHRTTIQEKYGVDTYSQTDECKEKIKATNLNNHGVEHTFQVSEFRENGIATCQERYGVDSYSKTKEFLEKTQATNLKNFGVKNAMQNEEIKAKGRATNIKRYGFENAMQNEEIKAKGRATNIKRYGFENAMQNEEIKARGRATNFKKFGFEHAMQNEEIKAKAKATNIKRYGFEHATQNKEIRAKVEATNIKRYGVANPLQNFEIRTKANQTILERYGVKYHKQKHISSDALIILNSKEMLTAELESQNMSAVARKLCVDHTTIANYVYRHDIDYVRKPGSYLETEMTAFLTSLDIDFVINTRKIIKPLELDFYLPEYNLAIEMNGVYWHSSKFRDKNYHYNKWKMCQDKNIHLVSVFEDDWNLQQDKVMRLIKSLVNKKEKGLAARKCQIRKITAKESRPFLNRYHLQSFVAGKHYGAYNNDQLVGVMTFGLSRNQHFELKRFVTDKFTHAGLFSKIFTFAQKDLGFSEVVSFSDNRWFTGNVYALSNFNHVSTSKSGYRYLYGDRLVHVSNFTKADIKKKFPELSESIDNGITERQAMELLEIPRVYDCGKKKWIWLDK